MGLSFSNPTMVRTVRIHTRVTLLGSTTVHVAEADGFWVGESTFRPLFVGFARVTPMSVPTLQRVAVFAKSSSEVIDAVLAAPEWMDMQDKVDALKFYSGVYRPTAAEFSYFTEAVRVHGLRHSDYMEMATALLSKH